MNKNLRKAITKRSELKSKANRTKRPKDISDYKKQPNLLVRLNKEGRIELIVKNDESAKIFNKHFSETVGKLNIFEWPFCETEYI